MGVSVTSSASVETTGVVLSKKTCVVTCVGGDEKSVGVYAGRRNGIVLSVREENRISGGPRCLPIRPGD